MTSFLQSEAWQHFQEALGRQTFVDSGDNWSYLAIRETGKFNTRLYVPGGPEAKNPSSYEQALTSLRQLADQTKVDFIRIEPSDGITTAELKARGYRQVTYQQLQPAHTQLIDLSPPEADILAQMSQNSRNLTRNYQNKGITIRTSHDPQDIEILITLLSRVAQRNHITPHSDTYFRTQASSLLPSGSATLYIADYQHSPIAAALVIDSSDTRSYVHTAADDTYRKLSAGTALVGQLILDAKRAGLQYVDLYGIAPNDDPQHPWAGFTRFKQSFGGESVTRLGTWELPIRPWRYRLYRIYQSVYRQLRRLR